MEENIDDDLGIDILFADLQAQLQALYDKAILSTVFNLKILRKLEQNRHKLTTYISLVVKDVNLDLEDDNDEAAYILRIVEEVCHRATTMYGIDYHYLCTVIRVGMTGMFEVNILFIENVDMFYAMLQGPNIRTICN